MQSKEFQLLITASAIDHVTVWRNPDDSGAWSVFGYGDENRPLSVSNAIEAARGGVRTWASLDTAHAWIRASGWTSAVTVDG